MNFASWPWGKRGDESTKEDATATVIFDEATTNPVELPETRGATENRAQLRAEIAEQNKIIAKLTREVESLKDSLRLIRPAPPSG